MNIINYNQYIERESRFFEKHHVAKVIEAGDYNERVKHYICEDGSELWECIRVETKKHTVEIKDYDKYYWVNVEIKFLITEVWDTDNSSSAYYIERC